MSAIKTGRPNHQTTFARTDATVAVVEQQEAINRLKLRRLRGVIEDDPIGFDSTTDSRYLNAPSS